MEGDVDTDEEANRKDPPEEQGACRYLPRREIIFRPLTLAFSIQRP
ncbi:MAG TPA: hypothetical protein VIO58_15325 [Candidatus Methanoperedens sp.]